LREQQVWRKVGAAMEHRVDSFVLCSACFCVAAAATFAPVGYPLATQLICLFHQFCCFPVVQNWNFGCQLVTGKSGRASQSLLTDSLFFSWPSLGRYLRGYHHPRTHQPLDAHYDPVVDKPQLS
jgi:hypothetical protein